MKSMKKHHIRSRIALLLALLLLFSNAVPLWAQQTDGGTFIESAAMKAILDPNFPRVIRYEMKGADEGKMFLGQPNTISGFSINGHTIVPTLTNFAPGTDRAVYAMSFTDTANRIRLDMEIAISISGSNLTWEIEKITKGEGCAKIQTIEVPNLNLVTIRSGQAGAQFKGTVLSGNVNQSGDTEITFSSGFTANQSDAYCYGFVSGNGLSAGLWSNSEAADDKRVTRNNGTDTISLTSSKWYYEYGPAASSANYEGTPVSEMPCAKVCIASDKNGDGTADWQDGAIAYRDIMNNPYGSEHVPELVNYRIAMNLGGQATNPFLMSADNIKKVYLATDGLRQAVLLKGYGNEGHDSANTEYGDIAEKLGGEDELKKLIRIAGQYNAEVGVHFNAEEAYPEARTFSDDMIFNSNTPGWCWMDQSYQVDEIKDLGSGHRYKRMLQFFDRINGTSLYANKWPGLVGEGSAVQEAVAEPAAIAEAVAKSIQAGTNIGFVYLDVWQQDSWETRKVAQQLNSLGWRFSTEYGIRGEYDSTWQHHAVDAHGGATVKGLNSQVARFIRNHQKDSFVQNIPSYGGAADNPLLGHLSLDGFEGWQNDDGFDVYISNVFTDNLPAKFLQHYLITKWENYSGAAGDVSPAGNIEKQITLKSSDGADTVVVTRKAQQRTDTIIERTITLNGRKILEDGAYLLPWNDGETKEEKLYHWNYDGGASVWELPAGWEDLSSVMVYPLSDQGRGEGMAVAVLNGRITLEADAKTAYVVVKGAQDPKKLKNGYGEYARAADPSFCGYAGTGQGTPLDGQVWQGDISDASIRVKKMASGDTYLVIENPAKDVAVSTKLYDLIPGQNYVAQIYVDNRSDKKASIEVDNGQAVVSNYTYRSIAENYIRADWHNKTSVAGSRMQMMQVSFTAISEEAVFTVKREAGIGYTHFDDIRIVPKSLFNDRGDGTFVQDFESLTQGMYPFVMGSGQGVEDPCTHISEYHAPYTQSGWGNVVIDDVISGRYALKQNDKSFKSGIIYRTIPQNFRFEAGQKYEVSFDYQAGSANGFKVVVGEGEGENITQEIGYLEKTIAGTSQKSWTKRYTFTMTGAQSGQSWFGLFNVPANQTRQIYGYYNLILDNLMIRPIRREMPKLTLGGSLVFEGTGSGAKRIEAQVAGAQNPVISYASANSAIASVDANGNVTPAAFGETLITVTAEAAGQVLVGTIAVEVMREQDKNCIAQAFANSAQSGEEASKAIDGNENTMWHTGYNDLKGSSTNPAIFTVRLSDGTSAFNKVRFRQRLSSGTNGIIKKYSLVWGNAFNETTHAVTGGGSSAEITTTETERANGAWVNVDIGQIADKMAVKYLQLRVTDGSGSAGKPFAAIVEFEAIRHETYEGGEPASGAVDKSVLARAMQTLADYSIFGMDETELASVSDKIKEAMQVLASEDMASTQAQQQAAALDAVRQSKKQELINLISEYKRTDMSPYTAEAVRDFEKAAVIAQLAADKIPESSFDIKNTTYILKKAYADMLRAQKTVPKTPPEDGEQEEPKPEDKQEASKPEAKQENPKPEDKKPVSVSSFEASGCIYGDVDPAGLTVTLTVGENTKNVSIHTVSNGNGVYAVATIGSNAFKDCGKLKTVTLGDAVKTIEADAFYRCKKLTTIRLGKNIKSVHKNAFRKCAVKKISVKLAKGMKAADRKALIRQLTKAGIRKANIK